ncbi:MAG: hypothetical protein FWF80_04730, partial [Defluviitaleaceae bacterium]|nr:hypothetical protein [Defluviitaleaceae bacterium]
MNISAKKSPVQQPRFGKQDLAVALICVFGFFVGRAQVFGFVNPLAVPFLAAFMGAQGFYLAAVFVGIGLFTRMGDLFILRYLLAAGMLCTWYFCAAHVTRDGNRSWLRVYWVAVAAASATFLAGFIVSVMHGMTLFAFTVVLLETLLAGALTLVIKRAHVIIAGRRRRAKLLSGEDVASLTVVFAGVIAGASDIYVGPVPLRIFFCLYVLCVTAFKGGASMAAAAGMLLGFFLHLAGYWGAEWAAILGLAGL